MWGTFVILRWSQETCVPAVRPDSLGEASTASWVLVKPTVLSEAWSQQCFPTVVANMWQHPRLLYNLPGLWRIFSPPWKYPYQRGFFCFPIILVYEVSSDEWELRNMFVPILYESEFLIACGVREASFIFNLVHSYRERCTHVYGG